MINQTILNYKIDKQIGSGGMASVYEATHIKIGTKVALKVMNKEISENENLRNRFLNEAKVLTILSHPNIVRCSNLDEWEGQLVFQMDLIDGICLGDFIPREQSTKERIIKIFLKLLDAVGYAHSKGLIHRDIKPSNILIKENDEPILLDFGISKTDSLGVTGDTHTKAQMGSLPYMSPEQLVSTKAVDNRTDIYSLGVTLYFMFTGKPAINTSTMSEYEIMDAIIKKPLPNVSDSQFQFILEKATAKNPNDRYQSCKAFADDLEQLSNTKDHLSTKLFPYSSNNSTPTVLHKTPKRPTGLISAAILFVVVIIVVLLYPWKNDTENEHTMSVEHEPELVETSSDITIASNEEEDNNSLDEVTEPNILAEEEIDSRSIMGKGDFEDLLSTAFNANLSANQRATTHDRLRNKFSIDATITVYDLEGGVRDRFNREEFVRFVIIRQQHTSHKIISKEMTGSSIAKLTIEIY